MLTKVEAVGPVILPLLVMGFGETDPYQILGIDGVGPPKANISSSPYFGEGEYFVGSSVPKRNIVINLGLNPRWQQGETFESLRLNLYKYFMTKQTVALRFTSTHLPTVQIPGYVEDCSPNIFAKDPQMQISVICPDPYFVAVTASTKTGAVDQPVSIPYDGSVGCGYVIRMNPQGVSYNGIYILYTDKPKAVEFSVSGLTEGDGAVQVGTLKGQKYARRVLVSTGATYQDLARTVPQRSEFPQLLANNSNTLYVGTSGWSGGTWTMTYYQRFGGI